MHKFKPLGICALKETPFWSRLNPELQEAAEVIGEILAFRTNTYVLEKLIDWDNIPDDPMFRMIFPHRSMLSDPDYVRLRNMRLAGDEAALRSLVRTIREEMNPQPGGQLTHNVPMLNGKLLPGLQHKYPHTVVFLPSAAQTCHAYCTYCFRWPQFVDDKTWKIDSREAADLTAYLSVHPEVTDVLLSGGDPMIMSAQALGRSLEAVLAPECDHVHNIRIGTKALTYWPYRFLTDDDSGDLLRLFERVVASGKSLSVIAHLNHPLELQASETREAIKKILSTGASIRMQGPLLRHVNDDSKVWSEMWRDGVRLGMTPYYMFVERDTGPRGYFEVPLARAYEIFRAAVAGASGLARTVRGPVMSSFGGKVIVDGVASLNGEDVFCLRYLQARDQELIYRPFFAKYDPTATWFDELRPARPNDEMFFRAGSSFEPEGKSYVLVPHRKVAA